MTDSNTRPRDDPVSGDDGKEYAKNMYVGSTQPQSGIHYTGDTNNLGHNIVRISMDCPCGEDGCPFNGSEIPTPKMRCDDCGTMLDPNPVRYQFEAEKHTAHNLVCPWCAMTMGCLD